MPSVDYVPLPPPPAKADSGPPKPTVEQEGKYSEVYGHFTKDGYVLPDEEKGELTEEEKFWLVRFHHRSILCCLKELTISVVLRPTSAC